jgi:phage baseplate assembly protein W
MTPGSLFGRGLAFPPRLAEDGRWAWSDGPQNVRESLQIILETEQRERLMLPRFGGGLRSFLFEPNTVATRHQIGERIRRAIAQWEPRVEIDDVAVDPDTRDPMAAIATIRYKLVATGVSSQLNLSVKLSG